MITQSKSIQIYPEKPRDVRLDLVDVPPLKDDEVQCRAIKSLISVGTEIIQYEKKHDKSMHRRWLDLVEVVRPSYSMTAEIIETGSAAAGYKKGDVVYALHPHEQYFNIHTDNIVRMPDYLTPEEMCWLTILRVGLFTCMHNDLKPYDATTIIGLGNFGFACLMFASVFNAKKIVAVDPVRSRVDKALTHGATDALAAKVEDVAEKIIELNGGELLDSAVDATATAGHIRWGQYVTKVGGSVSLIADPPDTDSQHVDYGILIRRGQRLIGTYINLTMSEDDPLSKGAREYGNPLYPMTTGKANDFVLHCLKNGSVRVKDLICGYASPADVKDVYEMLSADRSEHLGIEFDWSLIK